MFGRVEGGGMRLAAGGRLQLRKPPKCAECERGWRVGLSLVPAAGCLRRTLTKFAQSHQLFTPRDYPNPVIVTGKEHKMAIINMTQHLHGYINYQHFTSVNYSDPIIAKCNVTRSLAVTDAEKWPLKLQRCTSATFYIMLCCMTSPDRGPVSVQGPGSGSMETRERWPP